MVSTKMHKGKAMAIIAFLSVAAAGAPAMDPETVDHRAGMSADVVHDGAHGDIHGGNHTISHGPERYGGDLTWFKTGLGACGWYNNPGDAICAISHIAYDRMNVDSNPNHNRLCGRKIRLQRGSREIDVVVADRCEGCKEFDIDVTTGVFGKLGNLDEGRVHIDWWWI
ncbi:Barwin-related endoglucanase [Penicillium bovifimosum]|uniref:Barwin-related endoglucanase n=1 Tax=Penicillium bovifimosum TaxID=126998 RepID=A0A9W9GIX2_9EURO|nr:Barwin-related endoglucanase [Penicillium bovifimosum]KAJ5121277.1 Barwin-related endoglucanase [Penicillium bovifimosum]